MWIKYLAAATLLFSFSAGGVQAAKISPLINHDEDQSRLIEISDGIAGNYFIICSSIRKRSRGSYGKAQRKANRLGYTVINTNRYPNLRNGYWSVVEGPMARFQAKQDKPRGCYIKSGW